jgi:hypothetical protein
MKFAVDETPSNSTKSCFEALNGKPSEVLISANVTIR